MVHNTGNVAGALEGYAQLSVPTEYLPTGDLILDGVLERRLPYNRIDLSLDYSGADKVIIEPGSSGHFEFVALATEPWHWVLDMNITLTQDIKVIHPEPEEVIEELFGKPETEGVKEKATLEPELKPEEAKELEEMVLIPSEQTTTSSTNLFNITVTPLAPRIWFAKEDDAPCLLSFNSVDVAGNQTSHEIEVACPRVATIIALLPSSVSIVTPDLTNLDNATPPRTKTFEHTLVASGDVIDKETINVNIKSEIQISDDISEVIREDSGLF